MRTILLFILVIFFNTGFTQTVIKGKVVDSAGHGVANVNILIGDTLSKSIISFSVTNSSGLYELNLTTESKNLFIKTRGFNFEDEIRNIKNENQTVDFILKEQISVLEEVIVRSHIITKSGDTISYNINSFANQKDRVLGDVLKKIPGIKVQTDGTIFYNGEAVNKFYVDGKDLMEGRYGIITNSLPISSVGKVEVLENHQPIGILRDKVPSEKAALNIKLKNNITFTGEGRVGVGYSPFLWNVQMTPMFLSKKNQWLISYKTNNNGEAVENEDNILAFGDRYQGVLKNANPIGFLSVEHATAPNISTEKYLMNNVHFLSGNILSTIGKDWELKTNVSYINNRIVRTSSTEETFYNSNIEGLKLTKMIDNSFYHSNLKGSFTIAKNTKKTFFKNRTSYQMFWNNDSAIVNRTLSNTSLTAIDKLRSPTGSVQNSLSAILPWGKKLINLQSYMSYQVDRQTLQVSPRGYLQFYYPNKSPIDFGYPDLLISQEYRMESFDLSNSADAKFSKGNWTLSTDIGIDFSHKNLSTSLQGIGFYRDSFRNELRLYNICSYISSGINFRTPSWILSLNVPLKIYNISTHEGIMNLNLRSDRVILEPRIYAQKELSYWKGIVIAGVTTRFLPINELYGGYILTSPSSLSIMKSESLLTRTITRYLNPRIEYRNPLSNFFFNLGYNYSLEDRNQMPSVYTTGNSNTMENILRNNNAVYNKYSGEVGWFFSKIKSNISLDLSLNTNRSEILFNDSIFSNKNNNKTAEFSFNNKFYKWVSLDYDFLMTQSKQLGNNKISEVEAKYLTQKIDLTFYPFKNHSFGFEWNQFYTKLNTVSYNTFFYDIKYQYSWIKKKVDFEIKWVNISNTREMQQISLRPVSTLLNIMQIRPSYIISTVKFNFK